MTAPAAWRNRITGSAEEDPTQLLANPSNWRTHPATQRNALRGSLETVGWVAQVMVNQRTGHVVDGHARVEEAISRGEPAVPVVYVDLTAEEEALVLATLDPIGAMADRDDERLRALLAEVTVDDDGLRALLGELAPPTTKTGLTDPDDVPELGDESSIQRGDLFALGDHRLMCGDSRDASDVARLLGDDRVALIATDPPYGVGYSAIVDGRANQKAGGWRPIVDDGDGANAAETTRQVFEAVRSHAADGCAIFVWHPTGPSQVLFREAVIAAGVHVLKQIVWVKPSLIFGRHEYHWRHETAFYGWFEGSRARFLGDRSETTVWEVDYGPGAKVRAGLGLHPTQKPVEITARPIRNHTLRGDVIYEPFSGSGSAIIAAEQEGRRARAIDIDPRYVAVAVERWEKFTGQRAERMDG